MAAQKSDVLYTERIVGANRIPGSVTVEDLLDLVGLNVVKEPLYETREMWAEENAAISTNQAEWAYGNGAVGFICLLYTSDAADE